MDLETQPGSLGGSEHHLLRVELFHPRQQLAFEAGAIELTADQAPPLAAHEPKVLDRTERAWEHPEVDGLAVTFEASAQTHGAPHDREVEGAQQLLKLRLVDGQRDRDMDVAAHGRAAGDVGVSGVEPPHKGHGVTDGAVDTNHPQWRQAAAWTTRVEAASSTSGGGVEVSTPKCSNRSPEVEARRRCRNRSASEPMIPDYGMGEGGRPVSPTGPSGRGRTPPRHEATPCKRRESR